MDEKKRKKEKKRSKKEKKIKKQKRIDDKSPLELNSDSEKEYNERKKAQNISGNIQAAEDTNIKEIIEDIELLEKRKVQLEDAIKAKEQEKKEVLLRLQLLDPAKQPTVNTPVDNKPPS